ncbi:MAG TPA: APC family permease [Vicinamibacteria bacterium]|nr:APC family permease [Vicinamibacteria bacterium]
MADPPKLVRAIGRWDLTASVINSVIGSAIFGMPAVLAGLTGALSPLAALYGGLGILAVVLCHAEVASRFREPGGTYLYIREAFPPFVGFQAGWLSFVIRVLSMGANLNVFADYLGQLVPALGQGAGRAGAMCAVALVTTVINVLGVRQGAWTVDAFVVAKVLPLALLATFGVARVSSEVIATQVVADPDWTQAVLLLVFAYGGFEAALIPASEMKDPRRDTGFALLAGLGVIAAVYMLVQLAVVGLVPHAASTRAPVAAAFGVLVGPVGVVLASAAAVTSTWGWTVGAVLNSPRMVYSMAERGELPAALAAVHARFRTPHVAIVLYAATGLATALTGGFAANATLSAIVRLVTYALVCLSLVLLRRRGGEAAAFPVPAGNLVALLGVGFCGWLLTTRTFTQAWMLAAIMVAGWALSLLSRRRGPADRVVQ